MRAAHRAAHLALPHLKAGIRCALPSCPRAKIPTASSRKSGAMAMRKIARRGAAAVASAVAGRNRGQGFFHARAPRRAGTMLWPKSSSAISDAKIADYYRRDFEQRVFETFKRRKPSPSAGRSRHENPTGPQAASTDEPNPASADRSVSPAVKDSLPRLQAGKARRPAGQGDGTCGPSAGTAGPRRSIMARLLAEPCPLRTLRLTGCGTNF